MIDKAMNDLISRKALCDYALNQNDKSVTPNDIMRFPSAQPEQRWIPCSERLPEVYKDVLICWDFKGNREVLIGNMYSDGTFHGYDDEYLTHNGRKYRKAVAWMPLPEPYRETNK